MFNKFYQCWHQLCVCVCVWMHAQWHIIFWFSVALSLQWEFSLCFSPSVSLCFIHAPSSHWQNPSPFFVHPLLLQLCLLLWQHLPTVTKVSEGSSDIFQTPSPVPSTPKALLTKRKRKLPPYVWNPTSKTRCHSDTRDNGVTGTSLINRRNAKFSLNQQTVDSSRMSSRMTEKNIACTGTTRLNCLGDCPVKAVKEMQKTARPTFDTSCNQLFWTALLKSNWLWTLTDSSLNKDNNNNNKNVSSFNSISVTC